MNKIFQRVLMGLFLLVPAALAVQLSDLSPTITRTEADENLTKDYAYRVLSDLSVRRIWNLDDNRKLSIDFDAKTGKLICIGMFVTKYRFIQLVRRTTNGRPYEFSCQCGIPSNSR